MAFPHQRVLSLLFNYIQWPNNTFKPAFGSPPAAFCSSGWSLSGRGLIGRSHGGRGPAKVTTTCCCCRIWSIQICVLPVTELQSDQLFQYNRPVHPLCSRRTHFFFFLPQCNQSTCPQSSSGPSDVGGSFHPVSLNISAQPLRN